MEGPDREVSLRELLRIFRRQSGFILGVVVLLTAPIALYALLLTPKYTAVASVVVEPRPQLLLLADGSPAAQPPDPAYLETLASVIRSRVFTSRTMDELDLFADPEFLPPPMSTLDRVRNWAAGVLGEASPAGLAAGTPAPQVDWLETMAIFDDRLQVSPQNQSYVIKISFTSESANKAASIANSLAQQFIDLQLEEKSSAVQRAIRGISGRLRVAEKAVQLAEQTVADIRLENNFIPGRPEPVSNMQAEEIARTLTQTQASYALVNAKLEVIEAFRADGAGLEDLAEVTASPVIGQLRLQIMAIEGRLDEAVAAYGEDHPLTRSVRTDLDAAERNLDAEIDRVVGGVRTEAKIIAAQIEELQKNLAEARERSILDSVAATQLERAERDLAVKRSLYEALLRRQEETSVQESWLTPDVRLISEAAPPLKPSTPAPVGLIAAGLTMSLVFAFLLALLREQLDSSLRSNRQVERELGINCLGLVPAVKRLQRSPTPLVLRKPGSSYAQSVGAVWAQLRIVSPKAQVVLVTSALPGEGSSALALNLAACARQWDGLRTALIDLDDRSPRRGRAKPGEEASGVADLLRQGGSGPLSLDDVARSDPESGVDVFPVGHRPPGALSMGGDQAVEALLDMLRARYDVVVIDAPPLLGVSDARRLAFFADASLRVIHWGSTSSDAASSALQILRQASANVVGAVLTQVHARRQSLYGRGDSVQYGRIFRKYRSV